MKTIRIGNGAGFLGDNLDAPRLLAEAGRLDYLTLEYLAELTLSILARVREKNPQAGYAGDFLEVAQSLVPALREQPNLRVVTNAGGMNPVACAVAAAKILAEAGLAKLVIGVVTGDDLLPRLAQLQAEGCTFENLDTGEPLTASRQPVSANAYLGARPIVDALAGSARLVITGRVADASLTLGPAIHEFGWRWDDWDRLAGASVAGHIIECGAQATGGFYKHWEHIGLEAVGYPIAELAVDGTSVITKPEKTGGVVNRESVCEQLVYEIGDPAHYLTPDVDVDFTHVQINDLGENRVSVAGARGGAAPASYKVSLAYRAGFMASSQLLVYGRDCVAKARHCAEIVFAKLREAGYEYAAHHVELLGTGDSVPGVSSAPADLREVMLRITVRDQRREAVERFAKEFAPLITAGPAGLAGYAAGRASVRPVFAYWPTLVPRGLVVPEVQVRTAEEWVQS